MSERWEEFILGVESTNNVESVIYRSWLRSKSFQIDHKRIINNELLPASRFRERCQAQEDLIRAGKLVLPYLFSLLRGLNYMVLLADSDGYILEALGDPPFMNKAQLVYLSPGASWREDVKGTNAIGTALTEQTPLKVLGREHFVKENHFLACGAAPIRDPRGETIGVLDITGEDSQKNERLLEIVIMGSKMIEQNLQLFQLQRSSQLTKQSIQMVGEMLHEGFIAIDNRGIISEINSFGAKLLGYKREDIIGQSVSEVFHSPKGWMVSNDTLNLKINGQAGTEVISRLCEVMDHIGSGIGIVGVIQPAPANREQQGKAMWVGRSVLTKQVFERAAKAASTSSSVLITGESGTGKEVIARYIHRLSTRNAGPFVALNCAALPDSLVESELFGYADGAFTGAKRGGKPGKFELANGGTIFLDEIGDMPLDVQVALLRVLQEKEVLRIGDSKPRKIDVRVIAATHKNLPALVSGGIFRLDLYYRLKVVSIGLPPLRERIEDILDLIPYFMDKVCRNLGKLPMRLTEDVYTHLLAYSWPGNIRELENCIESMVAMAEGLELTVADLPIEFQTSSFKQSSGLLNQQTRIAILQALSQTNGKIAPAARLLGIGRNTLYRKMEELGI